MKPRTTTLGVDVSRHEEEIDRQRAAWMAAAQVGDRVAYEKLLHDCTAHQAGRAWSRDTI
jgi:hypothetical protein